MTLIHIVDVYINTAYTLLDDKNKSRSALYVDHIEFMSDEFTKLKITHIAAYTF